MQRFSKFYGMEKETEKKRENIMVLYKVSKVKGGGEEREREREREEGDWKKFL